MPRFLLGLVKINLTSQHASKVIIWVSNPFEVVSEMSRLVFSLRFFVNTCTTKRSWTLWKETKFVENSNNTPCWLSTNSEPVPSLMLIENHTSSVGATVSGHPKANLLNVLSFQIIQIWGNSWQLVQVQNKLKWPFVNWIIQWCILSIFLVWPMWGIMVDWTTSYQ